MEAAFFGVFKGWETTCFSVPKKNKKNDAILCLSAISWQDPLSCEGLPEGSTLTLGALYALGTAIGNCPLFSNFRTKMIKLIWLASLNPVQLYLTFLWTAEHDVLTKHKIKRNTEVVVLSPILSLKAEQQRKVINLLLLFSPSSPPIFSYSILHMCDAKATILVTKKLLFTLYRCRRFRDLTFRIYKSKLRFYTKNLFIFSTWRNVNTAYQMR